MASLNSLCFTVNIGQCGPNLSIPAFFSNHVFSSNALRICGQPFKVSVCGPRPPCVERRAARLAISTKAS